jgi:NDP-sugar pyrophosphorylase family protein/thiamine kinase-like enzyme
MSFKVFIPTAGTGSRLGRLTQNLNKSLISVGNRPVISHIIEKFPSDCSFVVGIGYKGGLVRDFLKLAYPTLNFSFQEIEPYHGPGSGLGYSLMCCEHLLREPFVFISCDTLVREEIPRPDSDWVAYASSKHLESYRSIEIKNQSVSAIFEKKAQSVEKSINAYIGLSGIFHHDIFWRAMHDGGDLAVTQGEAFGLKGIILKEPVTARQFSWFDTGEPSALQQARIAYSATDLPNILEKEDEAIWLLDQCVVKFSIDKTFIENRVERAKLLTNYVPDVLAMSSHFYSYQKVNGKVLSEVATLPLFAQLLTHCKNFWEPQKLTRTEQRIFEQNCSSFYKAKTIGRITAFYNKFQLADETEQINEEEMPKLETLLRSIDWEELSRGVPVRFHGDLHFENILWNQSKNRFTFIDWRQDFCGDLKNGDIYYDLAKLMHGLIVSHEIVNRDQFRIIRDAKRVYLDIHRKNSLVECERYFISWCKQNNYSTRKVYLLTALIFLNIAPLHQHEYSLFLYFFGKKLLKNCIDNEFY